MLTINYQDLQYKKPKPIKKRTKVNKNTKMVVERYPLTKSDFSASSWNDYKDWMKEQKLKEKLKNNLTKSKKKKKTSKVKKKLTTKEQYYQDLEHPKWQTKRIVIINRDKQCALCGSHLNLQVHHTKYVKGKRAWEYPNSTLVTLCGDCHQKVHQDPSHPLYPKFIKESE
jgi:hypothetical protein